MLDRFRASFALAMALALLGAATATPADARTAPQKAPQRVLQKASRKVPQKVPQKVTVAAVPRSVTVPVAQDTYVSQNSPGTSHASYTWLSACPVTCDAVANSERQAFARFTVAGIPADAAGVRMTLKLRPVRTTDSAIAARRVTAAWADGVTWADRPALGATLDTADGLTGGKDVELDVSGAFTGNGSYSFGISASSGAQAVFDSAEATSGQAPRLTVDYTEGGAQPTAGPLPFTMPGTAQLRAAPRKVFGHYFTTFPISIDNADPANDYYARNFLKPEGESGKHLAYGGYLRDRPIPRSPITGDYKVTDLETEVRQAVSAGLDGFTVDILNVTGVHWTETQNLVKAAAAADPGFKIVLMPDMNGLVNADSDTLAAAMAGLAKSPSVYRLADDRLVVSPFKAENHTPAWWTTWMDTMRTKYGIEVAFVPCLLDSGKYIDSYAPISYGLADFGHHNATANGGLESTIEHVHDLGKIWMQPISAQDARPDQHIFEEAGNTETLRRTWRGAIDGGAEWTQLVTWNDFSEDTQFAPSVNAGWTDLDISSYYVTCLKLGCPEITKDVVYLTHRIQPWTAKPTFPETSLMTLRQSPKGTDPRDTVEVLSMMTAPGTVTVDVGGTTQTYTAPAGVSARTFPLRTGKVSTSVTRDGTVVARADSPYTVTATPYVQDLQYYGVTSGR